MVDLTAWQLREKIKKGEIKVQEVVTSYIKKIEETDKRLNAYVYLDFERALEEAKRLDKEGLAEDAKLYGLPIAIKDNICVKDEPTTCCSKILQGFRPPYDATVIEKLRKNKAIPLGKTNMDEFAFGSSCETSCYGPTKNPHDPERVPGGSSGGSAAAVAAKEALWALGSDTGGSIRQPASLCGVVGLKPTYGRVSRFGLIAFASSLDQIGPITRDVKDAALLLEVIAGHDEKDSTSSPEDVPPYSENLEPQIKDIRIGIPSEYFGEGLDPEVGERIKQVLKELERHGAKIEEISLPHTGYAVSCYYIIAPSEASSNLARYDGVQYGFRASLEDAMDLEEITNPMVRMYIRTRSQGFGAEAKRRIILGTFALSSGYYEAYYLRAAKVRTLIKEDFIQAFKRCDCIIAPTSPTPAFKIGEKIQDPLQMYLSDIYTIPANLAGIPAISIPIGFNKDGLPIGLQIMCEHFQEQKLLNIAYGIEELLR